MLPAHKNSKPRTVPARMSAKRRAQFEAEGRVPFSTIQRKEKPWSTSAKNAGNDGAAITKTVKIPTMKYARLAGARDSGKLATKRIPPRKKRTCTPIRSIPWPNALDPKSYVLNGRVKLFGADKRAMRERIFARAGGRCEETFVNPQFVNGCHAVPSVSRCQNPATEWSHKPCVHLKVGSGHGQGFKCDALECGAAECEGCHRRAHGQY